LDGCLERKQPVSTRLILEGKHFGSLEVLSFIGTTDARNAIFLVRCTCGTEKPVLGKNLKNGTTKSCGCKNLTNLHSGNVTHGNSRHGKGEKTTEYHSWSAMKQRCYNPNTTDYHRYGGRGISVCARWRDSFENFLADMRPKPTPHHSIERVNNNKNYTPKNCKWATPKEQAQNRKPKAKKEHAKRNEQS
jgi:hypothetical protein